MMKATLIVYWFCLAFLCISAQAQELPYVLTKSSRIPMRDGVMLGGSLVIPKGMASGPVVLVVNCYPTEADNAGMFAAVARFGFILLEVHTRGKGLSDGIVEPYVSDAKDNYDIIEWVSRQPWCNGNITMGGGSYLGATQWAAAKSMHPKLKGIAPMVSAAPGIDFLLKNNIYPGYTLRWVDRVTSNKYDVGEKFSDNRYWYSLYNQAYKNGYAFNSLDTLGKIPNPFFQKILQHPSYDQFWKDMIPSSPEEFNRIDMPILTITGYFDGGQRGAMYYYNMHNRFGKPDAIKKHFLFIGPYTHGGAQSIPDYSVGGYKIDSAAVVNIRLLNLHWFNYVLNNKPLPALLKDRVNCFVMGSGWRHASSLGELARDTTVFFLQPSKDEFHALSKKFIDKKESLKIDFNPSERSDTIDVAKAGALLNMNELSPFTDDYLKVKQQLIFESASFEDDFDLIGSPVADLFLEFTGLKDCDVQIEWYEVEPDGKSFPLSTQTQRLSYQNNPEQREILKSGKVYRFTFNNTFFMAKKIRKGSKIRFVARALNDPAWQKNYGSGKNVSQETITDATAGTIKIITNKKYPSAILLPGMKSKVQL